MFSTNPDALKAALEVTHPAVTEHETRWQIALDAYDGDGGFLNGDYIWRFPRETDTEARNRREQARYHNYAATLIDYYVRKVFGADVSRETSNAELQAWWDNVDTAGTDMSTYMRLALAKALSAGHLGILADKTREQATGPSKADEKAAVFLTRYLPTAIRDWRLSRDEKLIAVKLTEDVPNDDLLTDGETTARVLLWDTDEWVRIEGEQDALVVTREETGLGLVPLVALRPFRHARWSFIGRPLLGDSGVLVALYNRASEQDNVLRDQAFSLFVVSLPVTGDVDVDKAKNALGNEIGTTRAVFAYGSASYQTPSMEVPQTLEAHQTFLIRELYRAAHIPFEKDSRDAQSADAIRLQHEELQGVLKGVADECRRVELALCKLFFAWTSATPEAAAAAFEAANVQIGYPTAFFESDPEAELKTLTLAMNAVPSKTFEQAVQKQIVGMVAGSLDQPTVDQIHAEIKAGEADRQPALDTSTLRSGAEARLAQFTQQQGADTQDGEAA